MTAPYSDRRKARAAHINEVIGENIRRIRKAQGLTQAELSRLLVGGPASESYFRAIENGHKQMSLVRVCEIADTLGVKLVDLFEGF